MRRIKNGTTYYTLPGGGIEPVETADETCIRELREEAGLDGRVTRLLATLDRPESLRTELIRWGSASAS